VLSGTSGLIYESIWSRYLGLFVGHSAYAQIIVLAIFLGGMSVGAMVVGQRSTRLKEPLLWYAGIELIVGVIGLVFHQIYLGVTQITYTTIFPALTGTTALMIVKWIIASALILPQSVLLGATFPCMSAGVMRRTVGQPGRVLALLYFANSIGAAVGVLVAGFFLIAYVGLPGTILTAACLNIVVALVTYMMVRHIPAPAHAPLAGAPHDSSKGEPGQKPLPVTSLWRILLCVSFATAVASFIYEISWIRMLSLVLGSATHAFELMLSAFILGLALGALWVHQRADRFRHPLHTLGIVQWVMGGAALATLPVYLASFSWMSALLAAFDETLQGYTAFNLSRYGISLAVMLPATFCAGITLPLMTKILVVAGKGERAIGWVYGMNTLGSIAGVVLAGLILLPWVGLKALLIIGAAADMAIGMMIFAYLGYTARLTRLCAPALGLATVGAIGIVGFGTTMDRTLLTSGVFRHGVVPQPGTWELLFYKDGRTATVAALRRTDDKLLFLSTNGKPDASLLPEWFKEPDPTARPGPLRRDAATQTLLALIPLAHASQGRAVAVIGQGSGQSSHLLLGNLRIEHFVTVEIEPEMIAGSRVFYPVNRRVFDDPRATYAVDDARSFFAAEQRRYDLILSEPSNPWVSGVSSLFTTEFYARIAPLLSDQGIFAQWLQLYELNDTLALSVLAALHQNFSAYQVFLLDHSDLLIIASNRPSLPPPDWSILTLPAIVADLQAFIPLTAEHLEAMRVLDRAALAPLLDPWEQPNSDFFPLLDLGAEQTRYLRTTAAGFIGLGEARFDIVAPFFGLQRAFSTTTENPVLNHPRLTARALGATLRTWRTNSSQAAILDDANSKAAVQRLWRWQQGLAAAKPPADWRLWLAETIQVEADLHSGTAGVIDEEFYHRLHQYLDQLSPPPEVCEAVRFLEGLARWDFTAVASAAYRLLQPAIHGQSWIPVDQLRDGVVVAKLRLGDAAGARHAFAALAKQSERGETDAQTLLLGAYLDAADKLPAGPAPDTHVSWHCANEAQPAQHGQ
jgi:predicted membrane-bound spermidine synthase